MKRFTLESWVSGTINSHSIASKKEKECVQTHKSQIFLCSYVQRVYIHDLKSWSPHFFDVTCPLFKLLKLMKYDYTHIIFIMRIISWRNLLTWIHEAVFTFCIEYHLSILIYPNQLWNLFPINYLYSILMISIFT